jgi:hypothetical protein
MASHFPADRFYKRHLDKKLHCIEWPQGQIQAGRAVGAAKLRLPIGRFAYFACFYWFSPSASFIHSVTSDELSSGKKATWLVTECPGADNLRRPPEP